MMERNHKWVLLLCAALAATGCGDDGSAAGGAGGAGGAGAEGGAGGDLGTPALERLQAEPAFAVVNSDYSSSSIAMLDENFELLAESWLHSGTEYPGLVAALSGDVALPTRQPGNGVFGLLDRFSTDVYSEFYTPSGNLNGQVRTRSETPGFAPNPNDVLYVDENSAWVTRYEPNLDPEAAPEDQGNDLVEINPSTMSLTGRRIDLSELSVIVEDSLVYARPNRAVLVGGKAIVGLDLISGDFATYGPGAVAIIDLEEGTVQSLPLSDGLKEELQNCGRIVPVPGEANKLIVSCNGPYLFDEAFNLDLEAKRMGSGVVLLEVNDGRASIEQSWAAGGEAALATSWLIAIDEERVVGVAEGDYNLGTPDELYITEIASGAQTLAHAGTAPGDLGVSAYDPDLEILFVPDASAGAVLEIAIDEDGVEELGSLPILPRGLPPRQVHLLK